MAIEKSITRENAAFLLSIIGKVMFNNYHQENSHVFVKINRIQKNYRFNMHEGPKISVEGHISPLREPDQGEGYALRRSWSII